MKDIDWIEECGSNWKFFPIWEMSYDELRSERDNLGHIIMLMKEIGLREYEGVNIEDLENRLTSLWDGVLKKHMEQWKKGYGI